MISYLFPPDVDAQAIRWYNFSKNLVKLGYSIDVLKAGMFLDCEGVFVDNVRVFHATFGPFDFLTNLLKAKIGLGDKYNATLRTKDYFSLGKKSLELSRKLLNSVMVGDYKTEWYPFCALAVKNISLKKYPVLITSQYPLVDSLIGLYIKNRHPNIFWIADIGDPVCAPYNSKLKKPIDEHFEKKIVRTADRVVVTNRNVRLLLSARYGVPKEKIEVITQGFDAERFRVQKARKDKNKDFTMLFSGTFYRGFREPDNLIEALYRLKHLNFKLQIAGRNELFLRDFDRIKEKVEFLGFVPYEESLKLQDKADVLVNISNRQTYQVPGKIYEYIGSKKPILNIVYDKDRDETAWFVKRYRIGVVCENRVEEIKSAVLNLYTAWENNRLPKMFKFDSDELLEFSWQAGVEKLSRIIEEGFSEG